MMLSSDSEGTRNSWVLFQKDLLSMNRGITALGNIEFIRGHGSPATLEWHPHTDTGLATKNISKLLL